MNLNLNHVRIACDCATQPSTIQEETPTGKILKKQLNDSNSHLLKPLLTEPVNLAMSLDGTFMNLILNCVRITCEQTQNNKPKTAQLQAGTKSLPRSTCDHQVLGEGSHLYDLIGFHHLGRNRIPLVLHHAVIAPLTKTLVIVLRCVRAM